MVPVLRPLILASLVWLVAVAPSVSRGGPVLVVAGSRFSVDGRARFLVGVSLFDALGPTEPADADLDALARWGVGIVRGITRTGS